MKERTVFIRILTGAALLLLAASFANAQKEEEDTASREITSLDFQQQRPKTVPVKGEARAEASKNITPKRKKDIAVITSTRRKYNLVRRIPTKKKTPQQTSAKNNQNGPTQKSVIKNEQIGVTFWRLRPIAPDEGEAPVFPVRIGEGKQSWTAERVNSTTRFKKGDLVRFTIESSRTGYLYIINRELYADGTAGEANIIFPTLRTRGGDNYVRAGSLIEIPAASDSVPYFTVKPKRADYAGEELVVLITNDKLPLEIGLKPVSISLGQFDKWFEDWSANVDIYDASDGEGIALTSAEALAANSATRALEQEEPLPQTIYKVRISGEMPLLVPFRMATIP